MSLTEKERAYLHGLSVETEWTVKFAEAFDENQKLEEPASILYLNAGAGNHALSICEKLTGDQELFAVCESTELQSIAQEKSNALNADLDFSTSKPQGASDFVLADSSMIRPDKLDDFIADAAKLSRNEIAYFVPTSGSFGEVFSYLWEVFLDLDLLDNGAEIETLIAEIRTVSSLREAARALSLNNINTSTKNDFLEFETGKEFVESPLIKYFLMPNWLGSLDDKEKEQVIEKLAQKIDDERDGISFRCSLKATVVTAQK